jgi:hypothetical protein
MKFKEWIDCDVSKEDIIDRCSDPSGLDADNYIYPLGCHSNFYSFKKTNNTDIFTKHPKVNTKLLFYSFNSSTDQYRKTIIKQKSMNTIKELSRQDYKNILDKNYKMTQYSGEEYYKNIGKYKFNISPSGNGLDCFRHYETWISKGIPVIEYDSFIEKKYNRLPILWTKDYSNINDNYLNEQYLKFLDKDYDFRRVLLTQYSKKIQDEIKVICKNQYKTMLGLRVKQYWNYSDYF